MENSSKFKNIQIIFFSGTGGTKKVSEELRDRFIKNEIDVELIEVFKPFKFVEKKYDLLIVLFPVYAFNAPYLFLDYIKNLPNSYNSKAAVISISGGGEVFPNLACRNETIHILEKKNHNVFYENMVKMPSNFFAESSLEEIKEITSRFSDNVDEIFTDVSSGKFKRMKISFIDLIISKICKIEVIGGKIIGKHIKVSKKCIMCKKCQNSCPTGNIEIDDSGFKFNNNCVLCMKCFYGCPVNAIKPLMANKILLKNGYKISKFF